MSRLLFENSKTAIVFAGVIVAGAVLFTGSDNAATSSVRNADERSDQAVASAQNAAQTNNSQQVVKPQAVQPDQPLIGDFAPDEDLIDNAEGIDPSPEVGGEVISSESSGNGGGESGSSGPAAPQIPSDASGGPAPAIPQGAERASSNAAINVK